MKYLSLLIVSFLLIGCGVTTEYVYIKEKEPVDVPKTLFIHPKVPEPIKKESYLKLSATDKEITLGSYILSLQKIIKGYTLILDNIELYIDEQNKIIKSINEENKNELLHK